MQRTIIKKYIKAQWETNKSYCISYGRMYITQEKRKFLKFISYWKTINIKYD